ncbi:uncharacterized protein LOC124443254 isoform X1 [Xenia sp. Carnegie-2017]|uniref:uncharacterized protein LOC124443254 isoform X1 n=1 Tax=Xenia sp. Carnegie-2017 TaxID=2897299 RepID=UPI001F03E885|nr:uncharacterized protein LOC124443254 isoform X1 [Xenia sp. Carnegie-2017]
MTDLRKSPFHLNRLEDGTLVCENDEEKSREGLETENIQLREEIRDLTAKLAACEYKQQREQRRQQGSPQENSYISTSSETRHSRFNSETESAQGRDSESPDKIGQKVSNVADSLTSNGSVFTREERGGSLIEDIKNADRFIALPNGSSVSDEETLTVMSNVSVESS